MLYFFKVFEEFNDYKKSMNKMNRNESYEEIDTRLLLDKCRFSWKH